MIGEAPIATAALPEGFTLLQITPRLDSGGVERVTLDTAAAVVRTGGRSLVASWGGALEPALAKAGARLIRLPVHSRNPLVQALNIARLGRLIRRDGVSLVHVRSRAPAFSALPAARWAGVPLVATYHGDYAARGPLKRGYTAVMTRGDLTLGKSRFTHDHIRAEHHLAADRLMIVPEGIDTAFFDPAQVDPARIAAMRAAWGLDGAQAPVLLLAARLTGWKGQRVMIAALSRLPPERRPWLILAGREQRAGEAQALMAAAAEVGAASRVRWVGDLDDMPAAYAAADLVVAPSTEAESFGRGVVEAMAMARPVIASPLGAPCETVLHDRTGWLAAAGDAQAWADAVTRVLGLPNSALRDMGRAARERVLANYSLEAMMSATFAAYRRVLDRRA